jgi:TetR/AcrR family transcriptional repressor of mexJK operon
VARPVDPQKRLRVIQAAGRLFGQYGFDAVTLEAIAARARVSRVTLYAHFRDKRALLDAVIDDVAERLRTGWLEACARRAPADPLDALGNVLLGVLLREDVAALERTLAPLLPRSPALRKRFSEVGPGRTLEQLAAVLREEQLAGRLAIDSPREAAEDLVALWQGYLPDQVRLGLRPAPAAEEISARVRRGTRLFRRAYAPGARDIQHGA